MNDCSRGPWFPAVVAWVVFCCAWGAAAAAQPDVTERIEAQRDRASEQAALPDHGQPDPAQPVEAGAETERPTHQPEPGAAATGDLAELPSIPPTVNPEELLPLGPGEAVDGAPDNAGSGSLNSGWLLNTLAALGVVIALIFAVRWAARKWGVAGSGVRVTASPIVEVLSRTNVAPRNHVVLLRIGSRILVVNDGPAGMRTLATVEDPDEVAGLLQSVQAATDSSMSNSFGKVMSKLSGQWSSAEEAAELGADDSEAKVDRARGALAGLRDRLHFSAQARQGGDA